MQTYSKQEAREHVSRLVESFQKVEATLDKAPEAQIENDYIRPLFRYLNWRTEGADLRMSEREVVLVETDRQRKRPDYRFQLNGQHLFFMDAKRVKYSMYNPRWQWQVYRYAYSTRNNPAPRKVDFGVLTDFQEFILLDCTFEAKEPEAVNNFRVLDWRYPDYVAQFDRLWDIFERNNVLAASEDRKSGLWACYLTPKQAKANRVAPDEGFLDKLDNDEDGWRVRLAKDMKKCSPDLTGEVITAAVQLLIDRLVFIKVLSDRDIDDDYLAKLAECIEANGLEQRNQGWFGAAKPLFDRLKRFYNGSIFAPRPELEAVVTSNRVVRDIIRELDPNHSPYDFSVLPVEILGTIYERFLGKVVRTTEQRVKIEDKPEVRKAGGVYYTPQYIVRYIVEQTVGKLFDDCKTPDDVALLKILDPACGSGSFLIGVYDALIEWHKSYYAEKTKPDRKAAYRDADGDIRLTAKLKRQILLNNIFGVDIDQQAVEVTRFSLSLKALEDTRKDELEEERNLFKETVLPDLKDNIVCGNSLIGTDILEGQLFAPEEELKLNPMNYKDRFPNIFEDEGFDAILGNPPYLYSAGQEHKVYFESHYKLSEYQTDFYVYFIERSIQILKSAGRMGMIVSDSWVKGKYFTKLREHLLRQTRLESVTVFDYAPFHGATIENSIIVLQKTPPRETLTIRKFSTPNKLVDINILKVEGCLTRGFIDIHHSDANSQVITRLERNSLPLSSFCKLNRGVHAYRTDGYGKSKFLKGPQTKRDKDEQSYHSRSKLDSTYFPEVKGKHLGRYSYMWDGTYISYGDWLAEPRTSDFFFNPKLAIRKIIAPRLVCTFIREHTILDQSIYVAVRATKEPPNLLFLLGILTSSVGGWYIKAKHGIYDTLYPWFTKEQLAHFPIPAMHFVKEADEIRHQRLVDLVEQMLASKQAWAASQTEKDKTYYNDKCKALDKQIDAQVYELYDLTAKEIAIVEEK